MTTASIVLPLPRTCRLPHARASRWRLHLGLFLLPLAGACTKGGSGPADVGQPLSLQQQVPAAGSTLASPPANVRAVFSAALAAPQVQPNWLRVFGAGVALPGTVALDEANSQALVFTPAASLPLGVQIQVEVDAAVAAADGSTLAGGSSWSFTITVTGATEIQANPVITVQGGLSNPELFPLLRTGPGEIAAVFTNNGFESVAFWSEATSAWSNLTSAAIAGLEIPRFASDGAGGVIAQRKLGVVHHERGLTSTSATPLVFGRHLLRMADGQTTLWEEYAIAGVSAASHQWDNQSHTWLPTLATANVLISPPGTNNVLGVVPFDDSSIQFVCVEGSQTLPRGYHLYAVALARTGVEISRTELGDYPTDPLGSNAAFAVAHANDNRAMLAILQPTATGVTLGTIEYVPGTGWGNYTTVRSGVSGSGQVVGVDLAVGGAAVVGWSNSQSLVCSSRSAGDTWQHAPEFTSTRVVLESCAVTPQGDAMIAAGAAANRDLMLLGKHAQKPWSPVVSARDRALLPGLNFWSFVAATSNREFLLVYDHHPLGPPFTIDSCVLRVQ